MIATEQIQRPHYARVGDHFVTEHPIYPNVFVVARVPTPGYPTERGVLFVSAMQDDYTDDAEFASQYDTWEQAASLSKLLNR